jgi:hypothetical protein
MIRQHNTKNDHKQFTKYFLNTSSDGYIGLLQYLLSIIYKFDFQALPMKLFSGLSSRRPLAESAAVVDAGKHFYPIPIFDSLTSRLSLAKVIKLYTVVSYEFV